MKISPAHPFAERANSIVIVLVFTTVCLIVLAGLLGWSTVNTRLTQRYCRYNRSIAAAEAATEKVLTAITTDYKNLGQGYVLNNLDRYRRMNPTSTENPVWAGFTFSDVAGTPSRTYVQYVPGTSLKLLSAQYQGLHGFANTFQIISNAREANTSMAYGAVQQELQLTMVPLFQFAMFYNLDYECNALPNMTVNGPVHCNANIYLTPVNSLTFYNDVTCAGRINTTPKTGNNCGNPAGTINFRAGQYSGFATLNLPVGTNNSATAVRQVVEPPPVGESATSSVGSQRFYNRADMIITVRDTDVVVTSGLINNFTTIIPWLQATQFIRTNITFTNQRENKTVRTTQIDINRLGQWNATNTLLRSILPLGDVRTIFVDDIRTQTSSTQPGIRLVNGSSLLPQGLTVATPKPLYIWGHYNCTNNAYWGTTNTSASRPAAIVADAITVLSPNWTDGNSAGSLGSRGAADTTVNAAFLAGIVETSSSLGYSGGIENFPRFLEEWTDKTFTYNGSMVVMFTSRYATAPWVTIGTYYNPPIRNWSFDQNFSDPNKLPPATPNACLPARGNWRVAQPLSTNVASF